LRSGSTAGMAVAPRLLLIAVAGGVLHGQRAKALRAPPRQTRLHAAVQAVRSMLLRYERRA
jgi:hypothetical protein